ncbi:MAG TPA: hypothetical protein VH815_02660 [Acidobacteriota bacterium]
MRQSKGTLIIGGPFGVPIYLHWSILLGGLLPTPWVGFGALELLYFTIGYFILIAVHEFGHVFAANKVGLKVLAVEMSIAGGLCRYEFPSSIGSALFVTSAGLLAQLLLLIVSMIYSSILSGETGTISSCLLLIFTFINVCMFVVNILPIKVLSGLSTDGLLLWKLSTIYVKSYFH